MMIEEYKTIIELSLSVIGTIGILWGMYLAFQSNKIAKYAVEVTRTMEFEKIAPKLHCLILGNTQAVLFVSNNGIKPLSVISIRLLKLNADYKLEMVPITKKDDPYNTKVIKPKSSVIYGLNSYADESLHYLYIECLDNIGRYQLTFTSEKHGRFVLTSTELVTS